MAIGLKDGRVIVCDPEIFNQRERTANVITVNDND